MSEEARVHHPYSPSTLQLREACPKYQPTQGDNEASLMGTMQHAAVETDLDDASIPDYRAMAVAQCKEYAEKRILSFGPGCTVLREEYLPIDDEQIHLYRTEPTEFGSVTKPQAFQGTTAGYLDLGIVSYEETHAEIIDWKFGKNAVTDAKDNLQGISYMLGLKRKFPKLKSCTVTFIQPHIDHETSHTFDISDAAPYLLRVRTVVLRAVEAARENANFEIARATVGTCLFCSLVGKCPAVAKLVIQVGKKYAPLAVPDDISTVTLADPAKVGAGLKLAQVVQTWADSYRKNATQKTINDEDFIPEGYILVEGTKTVIKNARGVGDVAKTFLPGKDAPKVEALYDIALTPLDKLISLHAERGTKETTVAEFRAAIIASGAAEMGNPYAFLRLKTDKDSGKTAKQ